MLIMRSDLGLLRRNLHSRAARNFASSSGCKQIVTAPTHIGEGVADSVLTDIHYVVGFRVGSPVGTSDHSAIL